MSAEPYVDSYYTASRHEAPIRPPLRGAAEFDVCVVGGGIAGCSTALHLAERGYRVALLEANHIGWGASGRSGAQAIFGVAASQDKVERLVGAADARRIWDVTLAGIDLIKSRIARHHIDCHWVDGQMHVAVKSRQVDELRAWMTDELHGRYDYRSARFVERAELRSLIASERYLAGVFDANSGHMHPLNYTLGLAGAAEAAGATIFEGTRVTSYSEGLHVRVETPLGHLQCRQLVLCGNAWLGETEPRLTSRIMPVGTYIVATEPLGEERARDLIANDAAVTDVNWVLDYFRRSHDHRLLFGGRVSYSGLDPFNTQNATRARMLRVFPQLSDVKIEYSWGGYVDITLNRAPHFGRLAPNIYFLQGFSGHGIALAGIAGQLVAETIGGTAERFDVFARIPHGGFPGGQLLRRPALVLAMLYYRIKDLL